MPRPLSAPLQFEFLETPDGLEGPAAAMRDVLRMVNQVTAMRGAHRTAVGWQSTGSDGRAVRGAPRLGAYRRRPDVLVVPGWTARDGPHLNRLVVRDRSACERLQTVYRAGGHVAALYTGVAILGEARLLDGRRASVPWPFIQSSLRHAPTMLLAQGEACVVDERVWTADSPALATELTLALLQACGLGDLAEAGRSVMLHTPERQRLTSAVVRDSNSRIGPGALERARRWLEDHLHEPYSLAATARAAAISERSLLRHFSTAFGQSPLQMLHELRITRARMLLETSYLSVEAIAERCGWRDTAMLRQAFRRATGTTPAAYRERFRLRVERRRWGSELPR